MSDMRIEPAQPPFPPNIEALMNRIVPPGMEPFKLFTAMARDPRLFERWTGRSLLGGGNLSLRQREIVIDRVTASCGSEYEWGLHVAFFQEEAGFSEEQLRSFVHGGADDPCWSADEAILIRVCDSLRATNDIDDDLWADLKTVLTDEAIIEMLMLAGMYRTVAYITNSLRLPLEDFGRRFPAR